MSDYSQLLSIENLTKIFTIGGGLARSKLTAVNNAGFKLSTEKPEIFTLAGESGSGKTTLAKIILGTYEPTLGTIHYKDRNVTHIKGRRDRMWFMKEVQPIFQDPFDTFNPLKRVDTYLYDTTINFQVASNRRQAEKRMEEVLNSVGLTLDEIRKRYPHELSGGQAQRVSVARSLITNPSLLIADEPVSMVDASLRMAIVNLFRDIKDKQGINVLYITHDLATAYYVSDRIAIMFRGNIVEMGPIDKVLNNPLHPYTKLLRESVPRPNPRDKWQGTISLSALESEEYARRGCKFAGRCPNADDKRCIDATPEYVMLDERIVMCHLYEKEGEPIQR